VAGKLLTVTSQFTTSGSTGPGVQLLIAPAAGSAAVPPSTSRP
jgi:hypothetical protein